VAERKYLCTGVDEGLMKWRLDWIFGEGQNVKASALIVMMES